MSGFSFKLKYFFSTLRGHIKTAFKTFTHAFILNFSYTTFNILFVYSCFTFVPNLYHKHENIHNLNMNKLNKKIT